MRIMWWLHLSAPVEIQVVPAGGEFTLAPFGPCYHWRGTIAAMSDREWRVAGNAEERRPRADQLGTVKQRRC